MKKFRIVELILVVIVVFLSSFMTLYSSNIYAAESLVHVPAGTSKEHATEIASTIYYSKSGTTIVLAEGYYRITGQAYLFENNITIKGAGKDKTFIYIDSKESLWGVTVKGTSCSLEDLTIERSTQPNNASVIKVMGGNNLLIKNVKTIGGYYGIDFNPSVGSVVDGCELTTTTKAAIGVGSEGNTQSEITVKNTTTYDNGWNKDIVINDSKTYGNSKVIIGKGNIFRNGFLCNDNYNKNTIVFENDVFPIYEELVNGNVKGYLEIPEIQLSNKQLLLEVGKSAVINGMVSPAYPIQNITWSSSDSGIVKVDSNGKITAIAKGTATIIATVDQIRKTCEVTTFKTESELPSIDTSKPTDKVDIGITDNTSKEVVDSTSSNIINAIFNNQEVSVDVISTTTLDNIKKAIENGATISTKVETKTKELSEVDRKDLEKINTSINTMTQQDNSIIKVAQYLDIQVMLESQLDYYNEELGNIHQLDKPITFTVNIPEELKADGRKYYVLRVHNGETTVLDVVMNNDGTLSFATDCFSTYALVYGDEYVASVPPGQPTPEPSPDPIPNPIPNPKPILPNDSNNDFVQPTLKPNNVSKTNDDLNSHVFVILMIMSMLCIKVLNKKSKQEKS